jgi:hypothetical protein
MKNLLQHFTGVEITFFILCLVLGLCLLGIARLSSGFFAEYEFFKQFEGKEWKLTILGLCIVILPIVYVIIKKSFFP